jgi:cell division protein FtsW
MSDHIINPDAKQELIMTQRFKKMDVGLFFAALVMLGLGIVLVYSSSFAVAQDKFGGADFFLSRHVIRALIAVACFVLFINVDYHVWGRLSGISYIVALVLLAAVLALPQHEAVNGAKRWLSIGPLSFQVSELACIAMILMLAKKCDDAGQGIQEWKTLILNLAKVGLIAVFVILEPNFSTALIVTMVGISILFVAGSKFWHITGILLAGLPIIVLGLVAAPYRRHRVIHFLKGLTEPTGIGYQAYQALVGLGNGGLFGVGLGHGKQKLFYLPEPHTDFVFSIVGEELGFIGLILVLIGFGYIIYRGFKIALNAPDKSGQLMAFGFTFLLAVSVIMHASVNVGLVPTTGVPLPFLSYGGMSLVFTMCSIGIVLNISSQNKKMGSDTVRIQRDRLSKFNPDSESGRRK